MTDTRADTPAAPSSPAPHPRRRTSGLLGRLPVAVPIAVLALLMLLSAVVAIGVGALAISPSRVVTALADGIAGRVGGELDYIVWQLRAPRVVLAVVVGAGLGLAGAVIQVIVLNPIADPFVLGLSSGASLGAVTVITSLGIGFAGGLTLPAGAFAGAALAGLVVFAFAIGRTGLAAGRLVMVGIAIGHLLSGATSFLILRTGNADATQQVMYWLLGSLSGAQWRLVQVSAPIVAMGAVGVLLLARRLDVLTLGDATAHSLGVLASRTRLLLFVMSAVITGTVVSVSGTIGFVGLVVPNLARILVGGVHRRLLPVSALLGALLMLLADTGARTLLAPTELPVGILTALVGVPVFVAVLRRGAGTVQ